MTFILVLRTDLQFVGDRWRSAGLKRSSLARCFVVFVLRCPGGDGWCAVGAFHRLTETKVGCGGHHWLFAGRPAPSAIGC